jgi:AcrR family transcriptional regulator
LALFVKRGIDGTTIEAITDRAGVAKGTFFNYFSSKDEILVAHYGILVERAYRFGARLPPLPARGWLERFYGNLARVVSSAPLLTRVVLGEQAHPLVRRLEQRSWAANRELILRALDQGRRTGELRHSVRTDTALRVLSATWTATLHEWIQADQGFPLAAEVRRRLALLLDGLTARPISTPSTSQ